jgi:carboxypeptidase Taq
MWARELFLLRRLRRQALSMSDKLVRAFARARSRAIGAWEEARKVDDFTIFAAPFEGLLRLVRERGAALSRGGDRYDCFLDEYEPGMTRARLEPVLEELRERLTPLVRAAAEVDRARCAKIPAATYSSEGQWRLCRHLLREMGFSSARGRLDSSTHPFTLKAGHDDVRMTIRVDEHDLTSAVLAALHEGGHGLYDQSLDPRWRGWLIGEAAGMGMHESQARLWENHVGRRTAFWTRPQPVLQDLFTHAISDGGARELARIVNRVRPGVIRVGADELSYHLHILLRYELELALLSDDLRVVDLPMAWRERSQTLLGSSPQMDSLGALQDVHWSLGMFGYFPSYSIGSLYAAQLIEAYEREHDLDAEIARGELAVLAGWLKTQVHARGNTTSGEEIMRTVTDQDPAEVLRLAASLERASHHVLAEGNRG